MKPMEVALSLESAMPGGLEFICEPYTRDPGEIAFLAEKIARDAPQGPYASVRSSRLAFFDILPWLTHC